MKTTLISLLGLLMLIAGQLSAEPKLDIDYKRYDFGWVPHNSIGVRYFVIRSIGEDTLIVNDITTSCTCLTIPLERQILPPGDSLVVPAIWEFGDEANRTSHFARVVTNEPSVDPEHPMIIQFEAIIVTNPEKLKPVAASPYRVEFSRIAQVDIDSVAFTLTNSSDRDLDLSVTSYPYEQCEISVPDSLKPNSTGIGWIKLNAESKNTEFVTSLTIRMTDALRYDRSLTIPVRRKIY